MVHKPPAQGPRDRRVAPDPQTTAAKARKAADDRTDEEDYEQNGGDGFSRFLVFNAVPSWLASMFVHVVLLLILAVWTFSIGQETFESLTTVETGKEPVENIEDFEFETIDRPKVDITKPEAASLLPDEVDPVDNFPMPPVDPNRSTMQVELDPLGDDVARASDWSAPIAGNNGPDFSGRTVAGRRRWGKKTGATGPSEAARAAALKWLAAHQNPDGSWSFDHTIGPCQGRCGNPGSVAEARNAATAMALLPFLGAGQTHDEGKYQKTVAAGLAYLLRNMKGSNKGALYEPGGRMYSHGLAAIVLCEAYGMTQDKQLLAPAQASLNYIAYAQDPVGGGWRYDPKQKGDTSVFGWQLMALKSGHMAYLQVDPRTVVGATKFLDSVQTDSGARYGYTAPGSGDATTAIGLLCRMYLGWDHDHPALERGVAYLDKQGPSHGNMYYNYYATQVMRHYGGEQWKRWNARMRDWLVDRQATKGHEAGSWYIPGGYADRGGRLYSTSMAAMILEVYYRYLPIYGKKSVEEDFPL